MTSLEKIKTFLFIGAIVISFLSLSGCEKIKSSPPAANGSASNEGIAVYSCPMHHQVKSNHPGDCPICHMALVNVKKSDDEDRVEKKVFGKVIKYYRNPMDPTVHSDVPMKDNMGMDYIPVYETEKTEGEVFTLSREQLNLSGAKIIPVERDDVTLEIAVAGRSLGGQRVSFQAFEQDAAILKTGMEFDATSPSAPGVMLKGKITLIDSILDPMTRTLRVDGAVQNSGILFLKTESTVIGKIKLKKAAVLVVPEDAVVHTGTREIVYLYSENGRFSPRTVSLGIKGHGYYEVISGLRLGDKVSGGPNFLLDSESKIESAQ